jgi:hypothetical protein
VWFNHVIKTLWPHIGKVVFKQAVEQAGPQLDAICKQVQHERPHATACYAAHKQPGM